MAIFVLTGGHSIATHIDRPMFLSRVFFMLEEGKRLRNGALQNQFLHEAAQALETRTSGVDVVEMVMSTELSDVVVADSHEIDSHEIVAVSHGRDDISSLDVENRSGLGIMMNFQIEIPRLSFKILEQRISMLLLRTWMSQKNTQKMTVFQ